LIGDFYVNNERLTQHPASRSSLHSMFFNHPEAFGAPFSQCLKATQLPSLSH
jgi:hypothetical protein